MKKNKIAVVEGDGVNTAGQAQRHQEGAKTELAATASSSHRRPRPRLPFAKADGERIWTYRHAMVPKEMPPNCW